MNIINELIKSFSQAKEKLTIARMVILTIWTLFSIIMIYLIKAFV